jgi:hypothetical protein
MILLISFIILAEQLKRFSTVYDEHPTKTHIKHLLFIDNLQLIGVELQKLIQRVRAFSEDICMEFEVDKCDKTTMKEIKSFHSQLSHQQRGTRT